MTATFRYVPAMMTIATADPLQQKTNGLPSSTAHSFLCSYVPLSISTSREVEQNQLQSTAVKTLREFQQCEFY
uniref:Uncharacterized protein n=1 Tax=Wuchereria bancrofti TaxID=6293 RepID=A0A1I8EUZ3_WUCBA